MDGPNVQYLGHGDFHDQKYEDIMIHAKFTMEEAENIGFEEEEGLHHEEHDHEEGHAQHMEVEFELRIYPSEKLQSKFHTNKPVAYTAVVVGIFAVTSFMFLLYDVLVQRRQRRVMTSAIRSNAIVSSLFPEQVKNRLMNEGRATTIVAKGQAASFVDGKFVQPEASNCSSRPIADLFPNASCL